MSIFSQSAERAARAEPNGIKKGATFFLVFRCLTHTASSRKAFNGVQKGQVHSKKHKPSKKYFCWRSTPGSPPAGHNHPVTLAPRQVCLINSLLVTKHNFHFFPLFSLEEPQYLTAIPGFLGLFPFSYSSMLCVVSACFAVIDFVKLPLLSQTKSPHTFSTTLAKKIVPAETFMRLICSSIMWYRAPRATVRAIDVTRGICAPRARLANRSQCCMISHDCTADQSHEYLSCNDFFGQGSKLKVDHWWKTGSGNNTKEKKKREKLLLQLARRSTLWDCF